MVSCGAMIGVVVTTAEVETALVRALMISIEVEESLGKHRSLDPSQKWHVRTYKLNQH